MGNNKRTQLDIALDIMEILAQEGINVNDELSIQTQKDVKTQSRKRNRLLKDMRIENIDEIIAKHNLDPNFPLGHYLSIMRSPTKYKTEVQQARLEKLGIESKAPEEKPKLFRNQLVEALYIMEELKKQGIDWPYIPQSIDGVNITLGDIDVPGIKGILTRLSLNPEYPIGSRIKEICKSCREKVGYHFGDEEKARADELGIFNSIEKNTEETLDVLKAFKAEGIDLKIFRDKCLAEIKDEKVLAVAEKLNLPKFYMIGDRISTLRNLVYDKQRAPEINERFKKELLDLGLMEEYINIHKVLEVMEGLSAKGINVAQITYQRPKAEGLVQTQLKHLGMENLDEFLTEYDIDEDFPIGSKLCEVNRIYREGEYEGSKDFSAKEKSIIKKFGIEKKKENEKHIVQDTIRLAERLNEFGIDVRKLTLSPYENGKQRSLELGDLPLTEQQMQQIKQEFELDEKFRLGNRIINIRQSYKGNGRIAIKTSQEREDLVRVGIVPELLALDVEQKELESRLEEIKKLKRESANLTKGKNQPSIGE